MCHTMQHWQVYIEWNEKLSTNCTGRTKRAALIRIRPSSGTKGDRVLRLYIIPLRQKQAFGVFGVSSDEYLNYAKNNRTSGKEGRKGR
jgi:hypothetical protein